MVPWDDLRCWCVEGRLEEGVTLTLRSPDQMFWSDASDQGWGATVADHCVSGVWLEDEDLLSISQRELSAMESGLRALCSCLQGHTVAVSCDNTTAVAYLRRQGGTLAPAMNAVVQRILCWTEKENIFLMPQFVPGRNNVVADALFHPNQVIGSEWMLHREVFDWLCKSWLVTIYLFASSLSHRCSVYFAPVLDPMAAGTDAMLQSWDLLQKYAFPLFAMISQILTRVRASQSLSMTLIAPFWPQRSWFPELLGPPAAATHQEVSPKPVHASSSCVETLQQFVRASGFSRSVAHRLGQARRALSVASYPSKWIMYRRWCVDKGHSVSNPSVAKVADYIVWLWEAQGLSLSSVKAHCSMLSTVFCFKLPELGKHRVLRDLLRSFSIERPRRSQVPLS